MIDLLIFSESLVSLTFDARACPNNSKLLFSLGCFSESIVFKQGSNKSRFNSIVHFEVIASVWWLVWPYAYWIDVRPEAKIFLEFSILYCFHLPLQSLLSQWIIFYSLRFRLLIGAKVALVVHSRCYLLLFFLFIERRFHWWLMILINVVFGFIFFLGLYILLLLNWPRKWSKSSLIIVKNVNYCV